MVEVEAVAYGDGSTSLKRIKYTIAGCVNLHDKGGFEESFWLFIYRIGDVSKFIFIKINDRDARHKPKVDVPVIHANARLDEISLVFSGGMCKVKKISITKALTAPIACKDLKEHVILICKVANTPFH